LHLLVFDSQQSYSISGITLGWHRLFLYFASLPVRLFYFFRGQVLVVAAAVLGQVPVEQLPLAQPSRDFMQFALVQLVAAVLGQLPPMHLFFSRLFIIDCAAAVLGQEAFNEPLLSSCESRLFTLVPVGATVVVGAVGVALVVVLALKGQVEAGAAIAVDISSIATAVVAIKVMSNIFVIFFILCNLPFHLDSFTLLRICFA
jgi:hypothetical protein